MIILLGASGYVGAKFRKFLESKKIPVYSLNRREADYASNGVLARFLKEKKPDFLINAAGYTGKPNVDACEDHKAEALLGNAVLPGMVAMACREAGVPWGHVSSGCIYNGYKKDEGRIIPFTEEDAPNFCFRTNRCSFYSGSKALGEEVLAGEKNCYIWRLRIPFNEENNPRNYLSKLLHYERLMDVRNSLSHLDEFVRASWECWEKSAPFGIYNVTNPGHVTTKEVTELIQAEGRRREKAGDAETARAFLKNFQFFKDEEEFMRLAAKTPRSNCVLDSSKLLAAGIHMRDVREALEDTLHHWTWKP
ncbi:MAG: sugar nucleotide-binding protein [bacterium]